MLGRARVVHSNAAHDAAPLPFLRECFGTATLTTVCRQGVRRSVRSVRQFSSTTVGSTPRTQCVAATLSDSQATSPIHSTPSRSCQQWPARQRIDAKSSNGFPLRCELLMVERGDYSLRYERPAGARARARSVDWQATDVASQSTSGLRHPAEASNRPRNRARMSCARMAH